MPESGRKAIVVNQERLFSSKEDLDSEPLRADIRSDLTDRPPSFRKTRALSPASTMRARSASPRKGRSISPSPHSGKFVTDKRAISPLPTSNLLARSGSLSVRPTALNSSSIVQRDTISFITKFSKKSALVRRTVVLAVVFLCSVHIYFVCSKQNIKHIEPRVVELQLSERTCYAPPIQESQLKYINYPKPKTYGRKECACTPVRLFAIVSMQRSGSGWFETLLNSHKNISSHGEIFYNNEMRKNISMITRVLDKVYNLDWNSSASKRHCTAAVGFKWMLNQGLMDHYEEIVDYFNRRGVSAILLFRRNHLRRLVSLLANTHDQKAKQLNGTHKAHVHSKDEADILARFKPKLDVSHLMSIMQDMDKWAAGALRNFTSSRHLVLYYEDLAQNQTMMRDVIEFLDVPQRRLVSRHVKIHTSPLKEQIENWKDVVDAIKGTAYESFAAASDYQM